MLAGSRRPSGCGRPAARRDGAAECVDVDRFRTRGPPPMDLRARYEQAVLGLKALGLGTTVVVLNN